MNINFSNINWGEVWSKDFWFAIDRTRIHTSDTLLLYIGAALVALGIILLIFKKLAKNQFLGRVAGRFAKIALTIGLLEGVWYLLRWQYVQALGTRLVAVLLLVWGLAWLYFPIKYLLRNYKLDMEQASREASRMKYLSK
jgi:hypothetical protein